MGMCAFSIFPKNEQVQFNRLSGWIKLLRHHTMDQNLVCKKSKKLQVGYSLVLVALLNGK